MNKETTLNILIVTDQQSNFWFKQLKEYYFVSYFDNSFDLKENLDKQVSQIILLDENSLGFNNTIFNLHSIGQDYDCNCIVITDCNVEAKLFEYLRFGIKGFCHTDISTELLRKAITVVSEGGVWIERRVTHYILDHLYEQGYEPHQQIMDLSKLTEREYEIAGLVAIGGNDKIIARKLGISNNTVKNHLRNIFHKIKVSDRLQLALLFHGIEIKH